MGPTNRSALDVVYATLDDCAEATGLVVVVDVIRAFTTAAHVLARGATEIWPVADIDEAFAVRRAHPEVLLMGEDHGIKVDGFDTGNSPSRLDEIDVAGRTVVQRTSAGTQGIARSVNADRLLAASFVCAEATARAIRALADGHVTFVVTGADRRRDGDEDRACADYLVALLDDDRPDPEPFLRRVAASTAGRVFMEAARPASVGRRPPRPSPVEQRRRNSFPVADIELATQVDRFDFAMRVVRGDRDVLRAARDVPAMR